MHHQGCKPGPLQCSSSSSGAGICIAPARQHSHVQVDQHSSRAVAAMQARQPSPAGGSTPAAGAPEQSVLVEHWTQSAAPRPAPPSLWQPHTGHVSGITWLLCPACWTAARPVSVASGTWRCRFVAGLLSAAAGEHLGSECCCCHPSTPSSAPQTQAWQKAELAYEAVQVQS